MIPYILLTLIILLFLTYKISYKKCRKKNKEGFLLNDGFKNASIHYNLVKEVTIKYGGNFKKLDKYYERIKR
jgi:hypothetical protein